MFSSNVYEKYRTQYCAKSLNNEKHHTWVFKRTGNMVLWICTQCSLSKKEND